MRTLLLAAFAAFALGASADKGKGELNDTLVVTTSPQMHCKNCENKIMKNIRFVSGTKKIVTSLEKQTVTIIHNSKKASFADYVKAFKGIGFDIKRAK